MRKGVWIFLVWIGCCFSVAAQSNILDARISFKIRNFGLTVNGSIAGLEGEIRFDPENLAASVFNVSVDANSVDTGIALRDNHLREETYLHVKKYPRIKFTSIYITKSNELNKWILTGELTVKDVARKVSFPFSVSKKNNSSFLIGEFKINRRDFGVGGKSLSMADEVTVMLNVKI